MESETLDQIKLIACNLNPKYKKLMLVAVKLIHIQILIDEYKSHEHCEFDINDLLNQPQFESINPVYINLIKQVTSNEASEFNMLDMLFSLL